MRLPSLLCAMACGLVALSGQSVAHAAISNISGTVEIDYFGGHDELLLAGPVITNRTLYGADPEDNKTMGSVDYVLSNDALLIENIRMSRNGGQQISIHGSIYFIVNEATNYDLSGFMRFVEYGDAGIARLYSSIGKSGGPTEGLTLPTYNNVNETQTLGEFALGDITTDIHTATGTLTGPLSPGSYYWDFNILLNGVGIESPATAVGGFALVFTNSGDIPEPASVAILAIAGGGLLLRRRK